MAPRVGLRGCRCAFPRILRRGIRRANRPGRLPNLDTDQDLTSHSRELSLCRRDAFRRPDTCSLWYANTLHSLSLLRRWDCYEGHLPTRRASDGEANGGKGAADSAGWAAA